MIHRAAAVQDPEQTTVLVELTGPKLGAVVVCQCVVSHFGTEPVGVTFAPDWRIHAQAVGLDAFLPSTEGFIETLARIAFARRSR
jgi:hypothetical protein